MTKIVGSDNLEPVDPRVAAAMARIVDAFCRGIDALARPVAPDPAPVPAPSPRFTFAEWLDIKVLADRYDRYGGEPS